MDSKNVVSLHDNNQDDGVSSMISHLFSADGDKPIVKDGVAARLIITKPDDAYYIQPESLVCDYETDIMTYHRDEVVEGVIITLRNMGIDEIFWMPIVSLSLYHHLFLRKVYIDHPVKDSMFKMGLFLQPDGTVVLHTQSDYFNSLIFEFKEAKLQTVTT